MAGDQVIYDREHHEALRLHENIHLDVREEPTRVVSASTGQVWSAYALATSTASVDANAGSLVRVVRPFRAGMMVSVSSSLPQ